MNNKKILVIDDEPKLVSMIVVFLEREGMEVVTAYSGQEGLAVFDRESPALIILDWMMPEKTGIDFIKELRQISQVPIILLTARAEEVDKLLGLEIGADDYIVKPFSLRELAARIKVLLRRMGYQQEASDEIIRIDGLTIDTNRYKVWLDGELVVNLTPTEFKLLSFLAQNAGKVFSRIQLLDLALGEAYEGYERSLDTHISNLRKKIEKDPANPKYIQTIYGIGYKLGER